MLINKKQVFEIVNNLLVQIEALRDDDERLVSNVLLLYLKKNNIDAHEITAFKLLKMYSLNYLPTVDYITRIRRKLQNEKPELRGVNYNERQKHCRKILKQLDKKPIYEIL